MPAEVLTTDLDEFLRDESRRGGWAEAAVMAHTADEVREALADAAARGWPVTIQGARTGITAGAVPEGGLILNCSRMNAIGDVRDGSVVVEPGAVLSDLRAAVASAGLFFPPDPTETSASIGGMLACNASGALSYRYGPTRNWVKALRLVLSDGEVLRVARGLRADGRRFTLQTEGGRMLHGELPALEHPSVKNAAGYFIEPDMELIDLFIGMEGTLGVIVEAELQLIPQPPVQQSACAFFPNEAAAIQFVQRVREQGSLWPCPPAAIEFFDQGALDLLRQARCENDAFRDLPELDPAFHTAICLDFHGEDEHEVDEAVLAMAEVMEALDVNVESACWLADTAQERETLKAFRHAVPEVVNLLIDQRKKRLPELTKLGTDMSVPDAALERVMRMYREGLSAAGLEHVIFGHIGDNHVHVNILPRTMEELTAGRTLYRHWAEQVVAWGGSISAEHGIGKMKTAFLEIMVGEEGLRSMKDLKQFFDPDGLLNPGNLF